MQGPTLAKILLVEFLLIEKSYSLKKPGIKQLTTPNVLLQKKLLLKLWVLVFEMI